MLNVMFVNFLYSLSLSDQVQIFNGFNMSLGNLIRLTFALAILSIVISIVALRKAGQKQADQSEALAVQPAAAQAAATGSTVTDPAIIAAITAAVTILMHEETGAVTAATRSAAGFTIRKIRRV